MKVYRYGLLPPHQNADYIDDQMEKAHRYQNRLIEIERARRERIRTCQLRYGDLRRLQVDLDTARTELEAARASIKKRRQHDRTAATKPEERARVDAARETVKRLVEQIRDTKSQIKDDPALKADYAAIHADILTLQKQARAECGVYWGTYILIEQAVDAARASVADPKFRRWKPDAIITDKGEGAVGIQIQGGLPVREAFSMTDTRLRIRPVSDAAWTAPTRRERRLNQYTILQMRVGSDGRAPIWGEWRLYLHRPLPETGTIKLAKVLRRLNASPDGCRWELQLSVEEPSPTLVADLLPPKESVVAIDLGWRRLDTGELRVAYWCDHEGRHGDLRLPAPIPEPTKTPGPISRMLRAHGIGSVRTRILNQLRTDLLERVKTAELPAELAEQVRSLHLWKSPRRFERFLVALKHHPAVALVRSTESAALNDTTGDNIMHAFMAMPNDRDLFESTAGYFRHNRHLTRLVSVLERRLVVLDGGKVSAHERKESKTVYTEMLETYQQLVQRADEEGDGTFAMLYLLERWRHQEVHLWRYEYGLRQTAIRHRRQLYREFAKKLVGQYRVVVMEDMRIDKMAKHDKPEDGTASSTYESRQRFIAAPGELRQTIMMKFKEFGKVVLVKSAFTTRDCHKCGHRNGEEIGAAAAVVLKCSKCGAEWDQDHNASINIIRTGMNEMEDEAFWVEKEKKKRLPRFAKRHKNQGEAA